MDNTTPFQPWAADESAKNVRTERELADDAKLRRENVNPKHTQTASYDKDSVAAPNIVPGSSGGTEHGVEPALGKDSKMDSAKVASMQQIVENTLSQEGRQRVAQLLEAVEALTGAERLLLYLRLPTGVPPHDPLKQPINPLGSRAELQQTVTWIQTHLEVDPDVSLPKQDVYDEYIAHCLSSNMKPLSTADFGKVMKQVYPSVRPRRLGTRGNSRYCYAGLRKKIKLEVPQLPDLSESSKEVITTTSRESERVVCEWAEAKLGVKFTSIAELSRHLSSQPARAPPGPASASSPPLPLPLPPGDDPASRQLLKQLKRKIGQQTHDTPGRPKKNKSQEMPGLTVSPPSTSYGHPPVKHESEPAGESYYQPPYVTYEVRPPYYATPPPPRAHPPAALPHEYRPDPYAFEPSYAPRDLTLPPAEALHNVPINLSSDSSLDLSTERDWSRRRPPDPHPPPPAPHPAHAPQPPQPPHHPHHPPHHPRQPLPGKKLILETYQSETQSLSPRSAHAHPEPSRPPATEEFPRTEYLPKKMRAAEILGGKLAATRHAMAAAATDPPGPSGSAPSSGASDPRPTRSAVAFLEDPKNLPNRSKSTAAALAREEQEAANGTRVTKAPTPKADRTKLLLRKTCRARGGSPDRAESPDRPDSTGSCCGIDGINIRTGMICQEKHSEILNRERVISICNIDKHDLDDYLNEGNSQEHEEELLKYFHQREAQVEAAAKPSDSAAFLETRPDPQDEHSQGKNEKISQLRELLAKNLKNQSGSTAPNVPETQEISLATLNEQPITKPSEGAFKPVVTPGVTELMNGQSVSNQVDIGSDKHSASVPNENGQTLPYVNPNVPATSAAVSETHLYNGNFHTEPQSPTTRTQQYDFVPISDGCHSPANFNSKSPIGFSTRGLSPIKMNKPSIMGGSLQTSPISHSTAASPFVSPRNTPVPRSRLCPRPIPKHNNRKRRNPLSLGVADPNSKPFAMPNDQKFMAKTSMCGSGLKYCQPMSAPPSPNIITSQYKSQMFQCATAGIPNGSNNMCLNFLPNVSFQDNVNGDHTQPLSADPLSSEVSQFFQDCSMVAYRPGHEATFRSQSVPLKQGMNTMGLLSYANTPVGSVPPTPVPNEFCDFGSLADTCDISKAGLNPETLDKIYDAIDSSNDVLNTGETQNLLNSNDTLTNGCDPPPMLTDEQLNSFIPTDGELLDRSSQFNQSFVNETAANDNVEDFLKRTNSIEFDLSELVTEKTKYYTSRSVPGTPLPYKRTAPNLQIDSRRSRELFAADNYSSLNGISSKSVPSTPQIPEERSVFSYSNRDFLINGNSVEVCNSGPLAGAGVADGEQGLASPLHDMLREDMLDPLTPAADLLADLDKMDGTAYDL